MKSLITLLLIVSTTAWAQVPSLPVATEHEDLDVHEVLAKDAKCLEEATHVYLAIRRADDKASTRPIRIVRARKYFDMIQEYVSTETLYFGSEEATLEIEYWQERQGGCRFDHAIQFLD